MYKILKNTSFGFVFQLENEFCYFNDSEYEIFLNNKFYLATNKNIISIFDLKCDTIYNITLKGLKESISFNIKTKKMEYIINVKDYNAIGNGVANDTSAINAAIYCAPKNSTIYIPKGIYKVDQILLKSHVDIYLEREAVLKQNITRSDLAVIKGYQRSYDHTDVQINASWEGNPLDCYCSLIYGREIENVHIYGFGTLDGSGYTGGWWDNHKTKKVAYRPRNVFLAECKDITLSGISSVNSAAWNIHPFYCKNLSFYNILVKSLKTSPNTDGLNPESCENVEIIGCEFSVGDDCIAIKSGKYFMSKHHYRPTTGVIINNCYMENGHGGVVIGSEMSCGVKNVCVSNCFFKQTDRGLRIKTRRGRGDTAIVENIKFNNIKMEKVVHCFVINMFYNCDPDGKSDYVKNKNVKNKDGETPSVKNIELYNINAEEIIGSGIFIYGLPESKVENIIVQNSKFSFSENRVHETPDMMDDFEIIQNLGVYIQNGAGIKLENNEFIGTCINSINEE